MSETYLEKIVAAHRKRAQSDTRSLQHLAQQCLEHNQHHPPRDFKAALSKPGISVIAEIKRRSPSRGDIAANLDPAQVAREYEQGAASCISVLTDCDFFGGSPQDLTEARNACDLPILRKDFTVCLHDIYDARLMGADAVLLIAAVLDQDELIAFHKCAKELGMAALFEIHDTPEIEAVLNAEAEIIGINQRDLVTFKVDTQRAIRVSKVLPKNSVKVAESGIKGPRDAAELHHAGFDALLVGESVVSASGRTQAVADLVNATKQ